MEHGGHLPVIFNFTLFHGDPRPASEKPTRPSGEKAPTILKIVIFRDMWALCEPFALRVRWPTSYTGPARIAAFVMWRTGTTISTSNRPMTRATALLRPPRAVDQYMSYTITWCNLTSANLYVVRDGRTLVAKGL